MGNYKFHLWEDFLSQPWQKLRSHQSEKQLHPKLAVLGRFIVPMSLPDDIGRFFQKRYIHPTENNTSIVSIPV